MSRITQIQAREVLDSRGNPTVEVGMTTSDGSFGRAIVPSGASTGAAEATELRDGNCNRYDGRGTLKAVENVNSTIAKAVTGMSVVDQSRLDQRLIELDGTPQKSRLGANAVLAVSLAAAHAAAASLDKPLYQHVQTLFDTANEKKAEQELPRPKMPLPMTNMISGGLHAGGNLDFQDVLVMPHGAPDYRTGLEWIVRVYRRLGELLTEHGFEGRLVGDEGGYGPRLKSNRQAIEFVVRAIEAAGLRPADDVTIIALFPPSSRSGRPNRPATV